MTSLSELRFFTTPAHDCSYLAGEKANTLFVDPLAHIDTDVYSALSAVGFRRSGSHIYRPYCQQCNACIPVRVPVAHFKPRRSQKRVLHANKNLRVRKLRPRLTDEYYRLYERYINARHGDGDMFPPDIEQFRSFLVDGRSEAMFIEYREHNQLFAIAVVDQLNDGLSAIYTFFEPEFESRSPGVFAILDLIQQTRALGLPYLYLGYWIKQSQKMNYKMDYQPMETYLDNQWTVAKIKNSVENEE